MKRCLLFLLASASSFAAPWIHEQPEPGEFPLVLAGHAAPLIVADDDFKVVHLAAKNLQIDIERVTGHAPTLSADFAAPTSPVVIIGTLGKSPLIDQLITAGKLDAAPLRGQWESFIIATIAKPFPHIPQALVIVGSDRRGTAFGVYELSQAIGVSPWHWWADVAPAKKTTLTIAAGTRRFGPPSVQYRGIFLNDEDWGLQPWAAKTFEPEVGDIGPKTYAKICELLLRLKANTLWPAMHACTKAFNLYPQNKIVADDYAIVMGSSHAEPMLRNNVTEWTAPHENYNYLTNREGVLSYWEQRVQENGRFENLYTLGMRGIHDSHMQGPKTDAERIATLEQIFADQRALLQKHVAPKAASVPQLFCAYKEVLALYRQGLKVPDDVTIVWPDDNFGYVRNFATPEEQKRPGGFGVYYHISYLGAPLSYLWLETTPPALIWAEMHKAYEHGAQKIWLVNVGDLKPAEIGTEFFLQMAWDIRRWRHDNLNEFLPEWAAREFGSTQAAPIASVMSDYFALNFTRKPEHLGWASKEKQPIPSPLTQRERSARLAEFTRLAATTETLGAKLDASVQDAFFELVRYPVQGSALANARYFHGERGEAAEALAADAGLLQLTRHYNETLAGGKWRGLMTLEPADHQWKSMRLPPWEMPAFTVPPEPAGPEKLSIRAEAFDKKNDRGPTRWEIIPGLGVTLLPTTQASSNEAKISDHAPRLDYAVNFPAAGEYTLTTYLRPTHSLVPGRGLRFAIALDDSPPQFVSCVVKDGSPEWAQGVLNNTVSTVVSVAIAAPGKHELQVYGIDAGVVIERFSIDLAPPR